MKCTKGGELPTSLNIQDHEKY